MPGNPINESRDFHPLVAEWLTSNGYDYDHEVTMPDYGRVDFLGTRPQDNFPLLVECKPNGSPLQAILQVAVYGKQFPGAKMAIAVVAGALSKNTRAVADKYNVQIIEIAVSDNSIKQSENTGKNYTDGRGAVRDFIADYIRLSKECEQLTQTILWLEVAYGEALDLTTNGNDLTRRAVETGEKLIDTVEIQQREMRRLKSLLGMTWKNRGYCDNTM